MPDPNETPIPTGNPEFVGLPTEKNLHLEEEEAEQHPEEAHGAVAEEKPEETPAAEPEKASEEEQERSNLEVARSAILEELKTQAPPADASLAAENERLRQRERELLEQQIKEKDEALKKYEEKVEGKPDARVNLTSPEIVRATAEASGIDPEEVERVLSTFAPAVQEIVETRVKSELAPIEQEREERKKQEQVQQQQMAILAEAEAGLKEAHATGGTAADLVEEYAKLPAGETFIGQYLEANPNVALKKDSMKAAVLGLAQQIDAKAEAVAGSTAGESTSIPAGSSRRTQKLTEPPETKTEEEELAEALSGYSGRVAKTHKFMDPASDIWK